MKSVRYSVNEIFYSLQGEGARAGAPSVFLRFSGCNLRCSIAAGPLSPGGWNCDTDHGNGRRMALPEILEACDEVGDGCHWIVLTGGEPALQLDSLLIEVLRTRFHIAIETNGTVPLPRWGVDWITVSPKKTEKPIVVPAADEVKFVMLNGDPLPALPLRAHHKLLSPAYRDGEVDQAALLWCIGLAKKNPDWRLSVQQHKQWGVR